MDKFKNSKLGNLYEWGGAIIIFLVFVLFLLYGFKLVFQSRREPDPVIVVRNHVPNYIKVFQEIKKNRNTDSLLISLLSEKENFIDSIQVLNRKIDEVDIGNTDTETKVKIVASIIAVIVAFVGFFGFKSLNDIREHTIKNSQTDAKEVAKKIAKDMMDESRSKIILLEAFVTSVEDTLSIRLDKLEKQNDNVEVIVKETSRGNEFEKAENVKDLTTNISNRDDAKSEEVPHQKNEGDKYAMVQVDTKVVDDDPEGTKNLFDETDDSNIKN